LKCHTLKLNKYYGTDINDNGIKYLQTVKEVIFFSFSFKIQVPTYIFKKKKKQDS